MAPPDEKKKKKKKKKREMTPGELARMEIGGDPPPKRRPKRYPRKIINRKMERLKLDNEIATSDVYYCQRQMPKQVWTPALRDDDYVPRCMRPLEAPLTVYVTKRGNTFPPDHDAHSVARKKHKDINRSQDYIDYGPFGRMPWFKDGKRRGTLGYDKGTRKGDREPKVYVEVEPGIPKKRKPFFAGAAEEEEQKRKDIELAMSAKNEFERKRKLMEKHTAAQLAEGVVELESSESSDEEPSDFAGRFSNYLFQEYKSLRGGMSKHEYINLGGPMFLNKCKSEKDALDQCIRDEAAASFKRYRHVGGGMTLEEFMRRGGPLLIQKCIPRRAYMLVDQCIKQDVDRLYEMYGKLGGTLSEEEFLKSAGPMLMLLFLSRIKPKGDVCTVKNPCMVEECEFTKRYMKKYGPVCSFYRSCMLDECEFTEKSAPDCGANKGNPKCSIDKSCMRDECGWTNKVKARQRSQNILKAPKNVCSQDRSCMYEQCEWTKQAKRKEMAGKCATKESVCSKKKSCMLDNCGWMEKNEGKLDTNQCSADKSCMQDDCLFTNKKPTECTLEAPCLQDDCQLTYNYRLKQRIMETGPCTAEHSCMMETCEWAKQAECRGRTIWNPEDIAKLPLNMSYTAYKKRGGTLSRLEFIWQAGPMSFDQYRNRGGSLTRDEYMKWAVPLSYEEYKKHGGALSREDFMKRLYPMSYIEYVDRGGSLLPKEFEDKMKDAKSDLEGKPKLPDISELYGSTGRKDDEYYDPIKDIELLDKYWQLYDRIQMRAYFRQKEKEEMEEYESSGSSTTTSSLSLSEEKSASSSSSISSLSLSPESDENGRSMSRKKGDSDMRYRDSYGMKRKSKDGSKRRKSKHKGSEIGRGKGCLDKRRSQRGASYDKGKMGKDTCTAGRSYENKRCG